MQKPILPLQIAPASAAPVRARNSQTDNSGQFHASLNREIEQRRAPPAAPARPAVKENGPAKAAQVNQSDKAGAAKKPGTEPARAGKEKTAKDSVAADDSAAAQAPAAATSMADMMALVASFNSLTGAGAPAPATDPLAAGSVAAPVTDAATASLDQAGIARLAAAGATLLEGVAGAAGDTDALPALFKDAMARLDGDAGDAGAAVPKAAPGREGAVRAGDAGQGQAMTPAALFGAAREPGQPDLLGREAPAAAPLAAPLAASTLALGNVAHAGGAGDKIGARVGTPAWDNQLGQKIVWMVAGKEQSASLTLNPPDMGPLQVVLNVTNEHATVTFSSATPEVRQALEDALPRLREMMSESGIALGNATVNDGAAQQQDRDQPRGQGARVAANPTPDDGASGSAAQAEARVAARPLRGGELPGLVDTFA